jgi:hypothetical protein
MERLDGRIVRWKAAPLYQNDSLISDAYVAFFSRLRHLQRRGRRFCRRFPCSRCRLAILDLGSWQYAMRNPQSPSGRKSTGCWTFVMNLSLCRPRMASRGFEIAGSRHNLVGMSWGIASILMLTHWCAGHWRTCTTWFPSLARWPTIMAQPFPSKPGPKDSR